MIARPIAFVADKRAPVGKTAQATFAQLSELLGRSTVGAKDGAGWMPAAIEPGDRTKERVQSVSFLVLDIEKKAAEPPAVAVLTAELRERGWRAIVHTSYCHEPKHPRYRVVFDLSRPLSPEEVRPLGLHVAAELGLRDCTDTTCLEPARLYYFGRVAADRLAMFERVVIDGAALDVGALLAEAAAFARAQDAPRRPRPTDSVIDAFNQAHDVGAILERHGYIAKQRDRWLWPGSQTGIPGVRRLPDDGRGERVYSSHGADPLCDEHAHDAFSVFTILEHGGDARAAVKDAAALLGLNRGKGRANGAGPTHTHADDDDAPAGDSGPPAWPAPLSAEAFHGIVGELVRAIEPHTEADRAAVLLQALVAFGALVGRGPHYRVEGDRHHANLFALMVGDTAKGRKGTSWSRVREVFQRVRDWKANVSGLSSGEGLKYHVRDPREELKTTKKGERVAEIVDEGVADKRLLVVESEFASALRAVQRQGNTLSATVREAWDTGNLRTLTKHDPVTATDAHIAIVGHITADELRAELTATDTANGFLNRFLLVAVRRSKVLPFGGEAWAEDELQAFASRLHERAERARQLQGVGMTAEARGMWAKVYPELSGGGAGLHGAVTARAEAQTVRLALLYCLLDGAAAIGPAHLLAALAAWQYCDATAQFIFGSSLGDRIADEIMRRLRAAGDDGLTRDDLRNAFQRNVPAERIGAALELLQRRGKATCEKVKTGDAGRPAEVWRVAK